MSALLLLRLRIPPYQLEAPYYTIPLIPVQTFVKPSER